MSKSCLFLVYAFFIFFMKLLAYFFYFQYLREKYDTKVAGNSSGYCSKFFLFWWNLKYEAGWAEKHAFFYIYVKLVKIMGFGLYNCLIFHFFYQNKKKLEQQLVLFPAPFVSYFSVFRNSLNVSYLKTLSHSDICIKNWNPENPENLENSENPENPESREYRESTVHTF